MKKLILQIIGLLTMVLLIVLTSSSAYAYNVSVINKSMIVKYFPSKNASWENSSSNRLGVIQSAGLQFTTTAKKAGSASVRCEDDTDHPITFTQDARMNTMLNFTVALWTNTTTNGAQQVFASRRDNTDTTGEWEFILNDVPNLVVNYWLTDAGTTASPSTSGTFLTAGTWNLIWFTVNHTGGTAYVYLGINRTTLATASGTSTATSSLLDFSICDDTTGRTFQQGVLGGVDDVYLSNKSLSTDDINRSIWNNGLGSKLLGNVTGAGDGGAPSTANLTITAADAYDSSLLTNFSVKIKGNTNWTQTTLNGTILIVNATQTFFNLTVFTKANGSYHNVTYENINLSGQNFRGNLTQSFLSLNVTDLLTNLLVSSFTVKTNFSTYDVTGGYILLPSKSGFHKFNVSSTSYPILSFTYTISALENLTFQANVSPRFQFYLRREADNSVFDVAGTNTTKLNIFCPNKNIVITFKNQTYNSTQENITMDCAYTFMKMDVSYPASSYFRSLIPEKSEQNITWWLLDLNQDTGVQISIQLVDLTGEFLNGILRVKRAIDQNTEDIIEQFFDIESSVVLYLLKDAFYTISVKDSSGANERQLGTMIADAAGTKTITLPSIPFYPDKVFYDNISWAYTFNTSQSILRLQYEDRTTNTSLLQWKIYNGTNATITLLQTFSSTNPTGDVTFTYNGVVGNQTYFTELYVEHNLLDFNITESRTFGDYSGYQLGFAGFKPEDAKNIKLYVSAIFLVVWGLLFSARHVGLGLTSTFIWVVILRWIGWFPINAVWLGLIGLIAFFGWVVEAMKK